MSVAILKYNAGNVRSVSIALTRLGVEHGITDDHDQIRSASHVILPGVGEASTAMRYLSERDLPKLIRGLTQPVLGICLGLQLFCQYSEENDTECLGVFPETVRLFKKARKVPHIGWNRVSSGFQVPSSGFQVPSSGFQVPGSAYRVPGSGFRLPGAESGGPGAYFYFVHSYYAELGPSTAGVTKYGEEFASVMQHDNFLATQFHPEKSAEAGYELLRSFLGLKTHRPQTVDPGSQAQNAGSRRSPQAPGTRHPAK